MFEDIVRKLRHRILVRRLGEVDRAVRRNIELVNEQGKVYRLNQQTATLIVDERFQNFDQTTAYAVSVTLALVAIVILVLINVLRPKEHS